MSKVGIRTLTIIGLLGTLIGASLLLVSRLVGATTSDATGTHVTGVGSVTLVVVGLLLIIAAGFVAMIAWIFALIRTAQLKQWGWFVPILVLMWVFGGLVTVIWSLTGPDAPAPSDS